MKTEKPATEQVQELNDAPKKKLFRLKKDKAADNGEKKPKKPKKVLNTVINVILVIAIIIAVVCTYISFVTSSGNGTPSIFGLQLLSIQTNSMSPTINHGDLIIDTAVDPADLRRGDIITYWTIINGEKVLNTHRIEGIYDGGDFLVFETKGDANTSADPLTVNQKEIIGKYRFRIPGLGKVFDYLQTSTGFLIVVVVPVFLFFLYHLIQFFRVLFEYQNIKNRLAYEQERERSEEAIATQTEDKVRREQERAAIEAELREKLRAEILASMKQETPTDAPADVPAEAPAEETKEPESSSDKTE